MGKCRDCDYCYTNESMDGLYICVNGNSEQFGNYTGLCCEDDCEDCTDENKGNVKYKKNRDD